MRTVFAGLLVWTAAAPALADTAAESFAMGALGSWTSAEQSYSDAYDWVESETVRIWPDRDDGVWLYQENAILGASPIEPAGAGAKDRPYFQVVIHVRDVGQSSLHTTTYRVADRAAARGAWRDPSAFSEAWLGEVACMGAQEQVAAGYWRGQADCPNTYKGAVRVVSRSVRTPDAKVNWDRGFDAAGALIWGPAEGGYVFKRKGDGE